MSHGAVDFSFDEAEFRAVIAEIEEAIRSLVDTWFPRLDPYMDQFFSVISWIVPDWVVEAAYVLIRVAFEVLEALVNLVIDLLEGVLVPISAAVRGILWHQEISFFEERVTALTDSNDAVALTWSGAGQEAFAQHAGRQIDQLTAMKDCAASARNNALAIAGVALGLYVGLGFTIAEVVTVDTVAVASTVIDGPIGPAAAATETGLGIGKIGAIVGLTVGAVGAMVPIIVDLSDKARAVGDEWPSTVGAYNDGSASDGDRTDWSTER